MVILTYASKHDNPKDMKAARMRSDSKAWEKAAESEMKSIADHDVLSRDFTLKELQEMGIYRKPIGCRFVLERKYKGDVYERHKARMVCQGHRGYLMPGRDFEDTYRQTIGDFVSNPESSPSSARTAAWSGCAA